MTDDHEIELKLRWRHTWEDRENDFVALPHVDVALHGDTVGRIHKSHRPGGGIWWYWTMYANGAGISHDGWPKDGYEDTPRRPARALEDAWFRDIAGGPLDVPTPVKATVNAYATAKGR